MPVHTGFNLLLLAIEAALGSTAQPSHSHLVAILLFLKWSSLVFFFLMDHKRVAIFGLKGETSQNSLHK